MTFDIFLKPGGHYPTQRTFWPFYYQNQFIIHGFWCNLRKKFEKFVRWTSTLEVRVSTEPKQPLKQNYPTFLWPLPFCCSFPSTYNHRSKVMTWQIAVFKRTIFFLLMPYKNWPKTTSISATKKNYFIIHACHCMAAYKQ